MRTPVLIAFALTLAVPYAAHAGDARVHIAQAQPRASDSTWQPRAYDLSTAAPGSSVDVKGIGTVGRTTETPVPQCVPTPRKVAEGACQSSLRVVAYDDGCGGRTQATEACASGSWGYFYRGIGGGDGWMNTSSVVKLACVEQGTYNRAPDESCGPKPGPDACLIGFSNVNPLARCSDDVRWQFAPNFQAFWGVVYPVCFTPNC